jgi:MSHA biogenesis protein MshE
VRRVCQSCVEPYTPSDQERLWLKAICPSSEQLQFQHGRGCSHCNRTGYRGRIGVFEFLEINTAMADALRSADPLAFARAARQVPSFKPLTQCALEYAGQGVTTVEEVLRVSEQLAEEALEVLEP